MAVSINRVSAKCSKTVYWGHVRWGWGQALAAFMDEQLCWLDIAPGKSAKKALVRRYPACRFEQDDEQVQCLLDKALHALAEDRPVRASISGTPFQIQVWQALTGIASGMSCTYGELAASIGKDRAARAVGSAAAANCIALFIPCHRLVPAAKSASGKSSVGAYRWGSQLKESLLDAERTGPTQATAMEISANRAA